VKITTTYRIVCLMMAALGAFCLVCAAAIIGLPELTIDVASQVVLTTGFVLAACLLFRGATVASIDAGLAERWAGPLARITQPSPRVSAAPYRFQFMARISRRAA
jgi:hypothetical protein